MPAGRSSARKASSCASAPFPSVPIGFWGDVEGAKLARPRISRAIRTFGGTATSPRSQPDERTHRARALGRRAQSWRRAYRYGGNLSAGREDSRGRRIDRDLAADGRTTCASCCSSGCSTASSLDDELTEKICRTIRSNTTPRHVPAKIIAVPDLPRTINGKLAELAVRNVVHGLPVKNIDALANPESLEYFKDSAGAQLLMSDGSLRSPDHAGTRKVLDACSSCIERECERLRYATDPAQEQRRRCAR